MRFAIDTVSLFYLVVVTASKVMCYLYFSSEVFWAILASTLGSMVAMLIKHNHCHLSMFKYSWLNYIMDMWLNLLTGSSCSSVKIIHNINHHMHINEEEKDWGSTHVFESFGKPSGFIRYVLTTPYLFIKSKHKWLRENKSTFLYKYNKIENFTIITFFVILCIYHLTAGILVFIIPTILLQLFLAALNYLQHYGHKTNDKKSNDVKSKWLNMLFFNVGYHTEHHKHPAKHWSLLRTH